MREQGKVGHRCYKGGKRKTGGLTGDGGGRIIQREWDVGDINNTRDVFKSHKEPGGGVSARP